MRSGFIRFTLACGFLLASSVAHADEQPAQNDSKPVETVAAIEAKPAEAPKPEEKAAEKPAEKSAAASLEEAKVNELIEAAKREGDAAPVITAPKKKKTSTAKAKVASPKKDTSSAKKQNEVNKAPLVVAKKAPEKPPVPTGSTKPLSAFELGRYQYCGDDRDCMVALNGCCDCANGGEDVAVNKERYEAFRARFQCLYVSCGEKTRATECATGVVSCLNHKCRYFNESLDDKF